MADTDIEWATKVWNFVRGCRRVSLGCGGPNGQGGCYAEKTAHRFSGPGMPYEGLVRLGKHGPQWTGKGRFVPEKLAEPLRWRAPCDGSRHRIFVNSMSDLFFEEFSNEEIAAGFGVMAACPQHDFLILTKRPERAKAWFAWLDEIQAHVEKCVPTTRNYRLTTLADMAEDRIGKSIFDVDDDAPIPVAWPLPNVWIGVSVEDQETAEKRIPILLDLPAAVRFVSAEPLLGSIDLNVAAFTGAESFSVMGRLDWVIVGGESGPGARPFDVEWARQIVEQCRAAGAPCFVKQVGALWYDSRLRRGARGSVVVPVDSQWEWAKKRDKKGGAPDEWPHEIRVRQFPRTP